MCVSPPAKVKQENQQQTNSESRPSLGPPPSLSPEELEQEQEKVRRPLIMLREGIMMYL